LAIASVPGNLFGSPITVVNPGFELCDASTNCTLTQNTGNSSIWGWTIIGTGGGTFAPRALAGPPAVGITAHTGNDTAYIDNGTEIYQNLGSFVAGQYYQLTVYAAMQAQVTPEPFTIGLFETDGSGNNIATIAQSSNFIAQNGIWNVYTVSGFAPTSAGTQLTVELSEPLSPGIPNVLFDDVSVSATPEPAACYMLLLGVAVVAGPKFKKSH
jgi:hypothetical protein